MRNIFVFGSNTEGRHGKGAALEAVKNHGAICGQAKGLQGNSYAIITKDLSGHANQRMRSIPLSMIGYQVTEFLCYAITHQDSVFNVSAIGCGLAGYTPEEIAPMFIGAPSNVKLPQIFLDVLNKTNGSSTNITTIPQGQEDA